MIRPRRRWGDLGAATEGLAAQAPQSLLDDGVALEDTTEQDGLDAQLFGELGEHVLDLVDRLAAEVLDLQQILLGVHEQLNDVADAGVLQAVGRSDGQLQGVHFGHEVGEQAPVRAGVGLSRSFAFHGEAVVVVAGQIHEDPIRIGQTLRRHFREDLAVAVGVYRQSQSGVGVEGVLGLPAQGLHALLRLHRRLDGAHVHVVVEQLELFLVRSQSQVAQGLGLNLADTLFLDPKLLADLLEGHVLEAADLQHLLLSWQEAVEGCIHHRYRLDAVIHAGYVPHVHAYALRQQTGELVRVVDDHVAPGHLLLEVDEYLHSPCWGSGLSEQRTQQRADAAGVPTFGCVGAGSLHRVPCGFLHVDGRRTDVAESENFGGLVLQILDPTELGVLELHGVVGPLADRGRVIRSGGEHQVGILAKSDPGVVGDVSVGDAQDLGGCARAEAQTSKGHHALAAQGDRGVSGNGHVASSLCLHCRR